MRIFSLTHHLDALFHTERVGTHFFGVVGLGTAERLAEVGYEHRLGPGGGDLGPGFRWVLLATILFGEVLFEP